jgi:hypothetical protein
VIKNEITKMATAEKAVQDNEEITPENAHRHSARAREFVKGMMKVCVAAGKPLRRGWVQ